MLGIGHTQITCFLKNFKKGFWVAVLMILYTESSKAQDYIFLRATDAILPCIIISANDTIVVYRTLDPDDLNLYSISVSEIYRYVLEDPKAKMLELADTLEWTIRIKHPKKKERVLKIGQSIVFQTQVDSGEYFRRGSIHEINTDSFTIEKKKRKDLFYEQYSIDDIVFFGYSNLWTEALSWIVFPIESVSSGTDAFYVKSKVADGWTYASQTKFKPYPIKKIKKRKKKFKNPGRLFRKQ